METGQFNKAAWGARLGVNDEEREYSRQTGSSRAANVDRPHGSESLARNDELPRLLIQDRALEDPEQLRSRSDAQANEAESPVPRRLQTAVGAPVTRLDNGSVLRNALQGPHDMEPRMGKKRSWEVAGLPGMNSAEGTSAREKETLSVVVDGREGGSSGLGERANTRAASPSAAGRTGGAASSDEEMFDDFREFTKADWLSIDEVTRARENPPVVDKGKASIGADKVARPAMNGEEGSGARENETPAVTSDRREGGSSGLGERANARAALSSTDGRTGGAFPSDEEMFDDFRDFTEAHWLSIDEVTRVRENPPVVDKGKATIEADEVGRPAMNGEEGSGARENDALAVASDRRESGWSGLGEGANARAASSSADCRTGGAFPSDEEMFDDFRDFTEADWLSIDEVTSARENPPVVDKGKAKIGADEGARPAITIGGRRQAMPRSEARSAFRCIEPGDEILIANEPSPELNYAMLFETPQQHFSRVGRWLHREEYDSKSVLIKFNESEGAYMPRNQLFLQLGARKYMEKMDELGLSYRIFGSVRTPGPHFYDTPAGRRTCAHNYKFPLQTGIYNPDLLIQHDNGCFIGLWPKLFDAQTLATLTQEFGATNVWLKAADNTYMTERAYNLREPGGAERAFAKFIARDDVICLCEPDDRSRLRCADIGR